jgi:hypothetical protein
MHYNILLNFGGMLSTAVGVPALVDETDVLEYTRQE